MHVSKCSPPARRFTNRVLDLLRAARQASPQAITDAARLDVTWFLAFLPLYNGVNLIKAETAQLVAQVDACTSGAGGICAGVGFFSFLFPESITACQFAIASLECYNVLVACRMWMPSWRGLHVLLYPDNWASVCSLNSGVAEDPLIRACAREIWLLSAAHDVELVVKHRPGADMHTADALSRAPRSSSHARRAESLLAGRAEREWVVHHGLLTPPPMLI